MIVTATVFAVWTVELWQKGASLLAYNQYISTIHNEIMKNGVLY